MDLDIAALKDRHGDLIALEMNDGSTLVFKRPSRADFDRWFDTRGQNASASARELAQACIVHPDRDGLMSALDRAPGILMSKGGILDAVTDLAGFGSDEGIKTLKKL